MIADPGHLEFGTVGTFKIFRRAEGLNTMKTQCKPAYILKKESSILMIKLKFIKNLCDVEMLTASRNASEVATNPLPRLGHYKPISHS